MGKNRTMAVKNAKVIKCNIVAGKNAMCADILNARKYEPSVNGLGLFASHAKAMNERRNKNAKWRTNA